METKLADNIRAFRKQKGLTQEQLAEALGVTVGAVHKWETRLSAPELGMVTDLADFFDVSVDVLLGYQAKDNRLESTLNRIFSCCQTLDPEALTEAEKALGKYPNSFRLVYACATVYLAFGGSRHDPHQLRRAMELMEQARVLLPQNENPRINDATICAGISTAYFHLGDQEKAIELLKQSNADGHYSDQIGSMLAAFMNRPEEAVPFLSEGMVNGMVCLLDTALGFLFVYRSRNDWRSALEIATLACDLTARLKTEGTTGYMDKTMAEVLVLLAYAQAKNGLREESLDTLRKCAEATKRFDSMPEYSLNTMRFQEHKGISTAFDILGTTASGSVELLLRLLDDKEMSGQWKEITHLG